MPPVSWVDIFAFLKALFRLLATMPPNRPLEITFSLLGLYVDDAVNAGLFDWRDVREDANGQCYASTKFAGHTVNFLLQVLPETGHAIARITADGFYLPNTHFLQTAEPKHYAVGNLNTENITALYARALERGGILHQLLRSRKNHACARRPCWNSCFGGLANAETELVAGRDLKRQPSLCLKAHHDIPPIMEDMACEQSI